MDQKKNLKPELKEIYDRVMNTPTGSIKSAAIPAQPAKQPAPASTGDQTKANFLTNVPPRHINNPPGKEFVYSAKNQHAEEKKEHHADAHSPHETKKEPLFNSKVLFLGVIFFLVWTMFWLVFFGVVKPSSFGL